MKYNSNKIIRGTFRINISVSNPEKPQRAIEIEKALVDTGAEYSWLPEELLEKIGIAVRKKDIAFVMANGKNITRDIGYTIIRHGEFETVDEVVFGKEGDLRLLGARTLEGFAAVVDARKKKLVASGPLTAA